MAPAGEVEMKAGVVVFAKMVGYPWWPAVVEAERNLPVDILEERPDSWEEEDLLPVRFLGDKSYAWLSGSALLVFTPDHPKASKKSFKSSRKSSRGLFLKGVQEAIELWNNPGKAQVDEPAERKQENARVLRMSLVSESNTVDAASDAVDDTPLKQPLAQVPAPEVRVKDELEGASPMKPLLPGPPRTAPSGSQGYQFRRSPKLSTRAAESGEVPGLRRVDKKRPNESTDSGRAAKVQRGKASGGRGSSGVPGAPMRTKGEVYAPVREIESSVTSNSMVSGADCGFGRIAVDSSGPAGGDTCSIPTYGGVISTGQVCHNSEVVPPQPHSWGENSQISHSFEHSRQYGFPVGIFMEEEVVALSVLVNMRN